MPESPKGHSMVNPHGQISKSEANTLCVSHSDENEKICAFELRELNEKASREIKARNDEHERKITAMMARLRQEKPDRKLDLEEPQVKSSTSPVLEKKPALGGVRPATTLFPALESLINPEYKAKMKAKKNSEKADKKNS